MDANEILCKVWECGYADVAVLEKTQYDIDELLERIEKKEAGFTLENLINEVFEYGLDDLKDVIEREISNCELALKLRNYDPELCENWKRLKEGLEKLDPDYDMRWDVNGAASSCWFQENGDEYRRLMGADLEGVEERMGFSF